MTAESALWSVSQGTARSLDIGPGARELRVTRGSLWLTGQGTAREPAQDLWLEEGQSVCLPSGSRIVVEGYAGAQFQLLVPPCDTRSAGHFFAAFLCGFLTRARSAAATASRAQGCISAGDSIVSSGALK